MKYDVAIVGATGAVGEIISQILHERKFPVGKMYALASKRSLGRTLTFGRNSVAVMNLEEFDFSLCRLAFFSAGSSVSERYVPIAAEAGCLVIDNTSFFRYKNDVPLIVREVNPHKMHAGSGRIIANPNCSTMQLLVAIKPIADAVGIERMNVATYQAVSGMGKLALNKLSEQTLNMIKMQEIAESDYAPFTKQMAFNVIPHIDKFEDNGYTREEMKILWETRKILDNDEIRVNATCVRVPVFYGHSLAVNLELKRHISVQDARHLLADHDAIRVMDTRKDGGYPTPIGEGSGKDPVYVGRIREDISHPRGLNLWIVADNLRKGAALNSVQLAELALEKGCL